MDAGSMAISLRASVWTHTHVTGIDTAKHEIRIGEATTVGYSKLVIAWGADTIRAPLKGDGLDHVYSVNDLLDHRCRTDRLRPTICATVAAVEAVDPLGWCLPTLRLSPQAAWCRARSRRSAKSTGRWLVK
jgi:rubredoxin-NAD+ reductase